MPIRFQVEPDFYDHPKVTGMSDAAVALWVKAGSFSAAKLSDGFVSEDVLVSTLRYDLAVAEELVRRGVWQRTRGGFRFHEWERHGNLTRARVEADREADRDRKRRGRSGDSTDEKPQVGGQSVRPESKRNPRGSPPESERNPGVSVSVSVSESSPPQPPAGGPTPHDHNSDPEFALFWATYPLKKAKPAAFKAWRAALKRGHDPEQITAAAKRYAADPKRKPDFTAHASTWLNQERYHDDVPPATLLPLVNFWDA